MIKINTDACFLEATMFGGTGLVVCDHQGGLIRGQAIWYEDAVNALNYRTVWSYRCCDLFQDTKIPPAPN